jgi:hypothetical protein
MKKVSLKIKELDTIRAAKLDFSGGSSGGGTW